MDKILSRIYDVGAGDTDCFGHCRPGALQYFLQDAATRHAAALSLSREELPGDYVWVITRIKFRLKNPIKYLTGVDVRTWHRGSSGIHFYRDFDILQDGLSVGSGVSAWVVLDIGSGKILRPSQINDKGSAYIPPGSIPENLPRLPRPEGLVPAGSHTVGYTDLDINGHMNNVRYCDIACDALELQNHERCFVRSVWIQFVEQTMSGQTIFLFTARTAEGGYFVTGRDEAGKTKFDALLEVDFN